ncbi:MAG: tetratricopeptide repeat protein, partial [Lentisphaeria bacterium]
HFTAWMIFCQAWFDKTLVQPPTQVAGYLCLGLLWRPWLACRLQPVRRTHVLRLAWGGAVAAALVLGLVAGGRRALASVWFRAGSVAEAEQRYPAALDGYARAARLCPEDPSAATLAGALAGNRLRNPQLALEFLEQAWTREPDFAHVNGEIGAALGQLGRHADALPFLERDARLYPYDPQSWQRYLMCCLLTEKWPEAGAASGRLADLADRKLKNALGEGEARRRCCDFVLALQEGRPADAQAVAQELLRPTGSEWADPGLGDLPGGVAAARRLVQQRFGAEDVRFWGQAWAARRAVRQGGVPVAGGLADVRELLAVRPVRAAAPEAAEALALAARLRQLDGCWPVLALDGAGRLLPPGTPKAERLGYPVVPLEFCGRTLVLGGLLKSELGVLAPLQADPPTLNRARCRAAAAAAGVTVPVEFYPR